MFQIRPEQAAAVRRQRLTRAFAATFDGSDLAAVSNPSAGRVEISPPNGSPTTYSFDDQGFVSAIKTPLGRSWQIASNEHGQATGVTNPAGSTAGFAYDARGRLAHLHRDASSVFALEHDEADNLTHVRYPDGTSEQLTYRDRDLLREVQRRDGSTLRFEHDDTSCLTAAVDGAGNRTRFEYSDWDRPDQVIYPDGSYVSHEFDSNGRLASFAYNAADPARITTDGEGRVTQVDYPDRVTVQHRFDANGNRLAASVHLPNEKSSQEVRWTYDDAGRVASESSPAGHVEYRYDSAGRLTGLVYPSGALLEFTSDADGRLLTIRDWSGDETHWRYQPAETGWTTHYPGRVQAAAHHLPTGHLRSFEVIDRNGRKLFDLAYQYDSEDRVLQCSDSMIGARVFAYDAAGRLTGADGQEFSFDAADNVISHGAAAMRLNPANQIGESSDGTFRHDARGNLAERATSTGAWQYGFDTRNQLVEARGPQGEAVQYGYDALGRIAWRHAGDTETVFAWAGETLIAEVESQAGRILHEREYLFIPGTHTLFATRIDGCVFYAHCDALGTPRLLTDAAGQPAWAAKISAWGKAEQTWGVTQPWRLPGQWEDSVTGLHYNRFRWYSSDLARYLSRDPLGYVAGLNLYAYAANDPVNAADPLGLWSWSGVVSAVAAVAVGVAVTAAIIATAPVSIPAMLVVGAAIVAGGAAAGAVGFGLNQALNEKEFCATCIAKEALKGALVGAVAALPFAFLPATAGVAAFAGAGALSGALSYAGNILTHPGSHWSWGDFGTSVALGGVIGGAGRYLSGETTARPRLPQDENVNPTPPRVKPLTRSIGPSARQNAQLQTDIQNLKNQGASDIRVNQQQVNADKIRVGTNRPDLQYTDASNQRHYVEYDSPTSGRGPGHADRSLANDPTGIAELNITPENNIDPAQSTTIYGIPPAVNYVGPAAVGATTGNPGPNN